MKVIYNGYDFSGIGEVAVTQTREREGAPDQPQRAKVTLRVRVDVFARSYDANREQLDQCRPALSLPNAVLQWTNDAAGVDYVNQTATLVSDDLPEEWGEYHQTLNLVFSYYEQVPGGAANNVPLTFTQAGGAAVTFDVVNKWSHGASVERFSPLRSQRRQTLATIRVEGQWFGDTTAALADRRAALAAQAADFNAAMNGSEGTLAFGENGAVFQGVVRIADWVCDVDQMVNAIGFSFTASYTLFPDEANYATAEFTAEERDEMNGQVGLTVTGRIQAPTEAAARTKLAAVLAAQVAARAYAGGQQLALDTTAAAVDGDDGATFIELAFTAGYRKWKGTNQAGTLAGVALGNVNAWRDEVTTERFDPLRSQRVRTTGTLAASGTLRADLTLAVGDRRAQLLAAQRALKAAAATAAAALVYGDFTQTVRVANFTAEINQAETGIEWSLTASYTLFPAEASYATAEWTAAERDDFTGQLTLEISGRVQAQDEPAARTKLAALLAQAVAERGYDRGQALAVATTPNRIDANADGVTFTELGFSASYRQWKATNLTAAVTNAAGAAVPLGNVNRWRDSLSVQRAHPLRKQRERVTETVEAAGTLAGDQRLALPDRRAALLALQRQLKAAVNVAEVTLAYGDWKQTVRVSEFSAEINQAETGIDWSLAASYTLFPTENNYTLAEFTAEERDDYTGQVLLTVAGKIQSDSEANARTKLAAVLAAVLAQRSYGAAAQALQLDTTAATLDGPDGVTFTELAFNAGYRKWKPTNQGATFQATGGRKKIPFGNVRTWRDHYAAQRFNEMRSQRRHATGSVDAAGTWTPPDATLAVADRRAALLAMQRAMKAEVNSADGTLIYGDWSQVVRVEDFQAEINQAETGIDWSLSASYSLFPNEGGYATAEFTVDSRDEVEAGDEVMAFAGRIEAPNGAAARAKLTTLRTAVLALYGWTVAQRLRTNSTVSAIDANGDRTRGVAEGLEAAANNFSAVSLNFAEEYRRRSTGALVSSTLTRVDREDIATQTLLTTFSGTVTATGPNVDAAYATALARAQALGADREASIDASTVFKGSTIAQESRQTTAANVTEFVRLTFTYEYQSKLQAGRAFIELNTQVMHDTFGMDTETCTGSVLARDLATAQELYAEQVRGLYAGRLIQSEQTGGAQTLTQTAAGFTGQHVRLEFNLTVFAPKAAGTVTIKYSVEVNRDLLTLELRTAVAGSCYAVNRPAADAVLDGLFKLLNLGASARSRRVEDHENDGTLDALLKLDFAEEFVGRVTGSSGVLEMTLTESVQFSGTRWTVQNFPFVGGVIGQGGVPLPQPSGVEAGSRTVSGSVTAATLATAQAWAVKQQALLTGDKLGNKYPQPPKMEIGYEFVPRMDGIAQGDGANVRLFKVSFTYAEILPWYPAA